MASVATVTRSDLWRTSASKAFETRGKTPRQIHAQILKTDPSSPITLEQVSEYLTGNENGSDLTLRTVVRELPRMSDDKRRELRREFVGLLKKMNNSGVSEERLEDFAKGLVPAFARGTMQAYDGGSAKLTAVLNNPAFASAMISELAFLHEYTGMEVMGVGLEHALVNAGRRAKFDARLEPRNNPGADVKMSSVQISAPDDSEENGAKATNILSRIQVKSSGTVDWKLAHFGSHKEDLEDTESTMRAVNEIRKYLTKWDFLTQTIVSSGSFAENDLGAPDQPAWVYDTNELRRSAIITALENIEEEDLIRSMTVKVGGRFEPAFTPSGKLRPVAHGKKIGIPLYSRGKEICGRFALSPRSHDSSLAGLDESMWKPLHKISVDPPSSL